MNNQIVEFDVAIIGAGPAGSACANSLCLKGKHKVALVDRELFPRDKSCGDGIGPGVVHVLSQLRLSDVLSEHRPIANLSVSSPSGYRATGPLPMVGGDIPKGYTIPRKEFDNKLVQAALERGAFDYTGHSFEDASFSNGKWTIKLVNRQTRESVFLKARVLVGADGPRSKIRKIMGVPDNPDTHMGTAVRIYAEDPSVSLHNLTIDFTQELLPAYGWVFPIDNSMANVGVGIDLDNFKKKGAKLKELLNSYSKNFDFYFDESSYNSYILPYWWNKVRLADYGKNVALIGDAGSMVNPMTGEGIYYGMYAGELLGGKLSKVLTEGKYNRFLGALSEYEIEFKKKFRNHYDINWKMKLKVQDPRWCDLVVKACRKDGVVLGTLIDMMMGDKDDMDFSTYMRIAVRGVLPF